jgi:tRNA-2-methylthio-N6-dimethylallyladenosine synthase
MSINTPSLKGLYIKSYGCQMNVYDSERMEENLENFGYKKVAKPEEASVIILNTCHIRHNPTENVYSELGRIKQHKDAARAKGDDVVVIVAGCVAQAEGDIIIKRAPVVDIVVGTEAYQHLPDMINKVLRDRSSKLIKLDFETLDKFDALKSGRKYRGPSAFVSVQEGCDKFCTFCVVPYTRGAEHSRKVSDITDEVKMLADKGVKDISLLGQNVNAFHGEGIDGTEVSLAKLIELVSNIDGIERVRYTTSHPLNMTDDLIEAHALNPKLMPYLHLPVQSGSNAILKAMNRKHTRDAYIKIIDRLKALRPDIAFSSDFIIGFPGETDADFNDTLELIRYVKYSQCYSFKYSQRPGTPADLMPNQVDEAVKDERLQQIQQLLSQQFKDFKSSFLGRTIPILFDGKGTRAGQNQAKGKSPYLQAVVVGLADGDDYQNYLGRIKNVQITEVKTNSLAGIFVD